MKKNWVYQIRQHSAFEKIQAAVLLAALTVPMFFSPPRALVAQAVNVPNLGTT